MTKAEVMELVRKSGMTFHLGMPHEAVMEQLTRFANVVLAAPQEPDDLTIAYMSGFHDGKKKAASHGEPIGKILEVEDDGTLLAGFYQELPVGTLLYTAPALLSESKLAEALTKANKVIEKAISDRDVLMEALEMIEPGTACNYSKRIAHAAIQKVQP